MRRREFMVALGGAATLPLPLFAQQARTPVIGVLVLGSPDPELFLKGLREGLRDAGYTENGQIRFEIRNGEAQADLLRPLAEELVFLKVDLIVTLQTPPSIAAKQATSEIPIVMSQVGDPVGNGLVNSLARPGGNVTGLAGGAAEVAGKVVERVREVLPAARRIGVLANSADPFTPVFLAGVAAGARSVAMELEPIMVRPTDLFEPVFATMGEKQVEALIPMTTLLRADVVDLALKHRMPLFSTSRVVPVSGGLLSYGVDLPALYRETAVYVDRILKGAKPADLPVAFPTKFELVINLKTAQALGLTIPSTLLARADEIIE